MRVWVIKVYFEKTISHKHLHFVENVRFLLTQLNQHHIFSALHHLRTCVFKLLFWLNNVPQCSHLYGFSPVWVRWWIFKWPLSANNLPHTSQEKGFSPVCVRMCLLREPFNAQVKSQSLQENGLLPVCVRRCLFKSLLFVKPLPHSLHLWGFSACLLVSLSVTQYVRYTTIFDVLMCTFTKN